MYLLIIFKLTVYFWPALGLSFEPCSESNYMGTCELVEFNSCQNTKIMTWANELSMQDSINSIRIVNGCVRLFENEYCKGKSQAYYTGAWGLQDLRRDGFNGLASSIGPCLEFECANKNIDYGEFDCVSHDSIYVGENPNRKTIEVKDENNPIVKYQLGYLDRVEFVLAKFKSHHLNSGSKADSKAKAYAAQMGMKGDVAGLIIGWRLGGNGSLTYNVFPQNGYVANSMYAEIIERLVFASVAQNYDVQWQVNLYYDDAKATRPSALIYYYNSHALRHIPNPIMN